MKNNLGIRRKYTFLGLHSGHTFETLENGALGACALSQLEIQRKPQLPIKPSHLLEATHCLNLGYKSIVYYFKGNTWLIPLPFFFFFSFFSYDPTVLLPVLLKSWDRLDCQQLWGASELKEQERRWKRKNAKVDSRVCYQFDHQTSDRYSAYDTFTKVLWNVRAVCLVSSHHFLDKQLLRY